MNAQSNPGSDGGAPAPAPAPAAPAATPAPTPAAAATPNPAPADPANPAPAPSPAPAPAATRPDYIPEAFWDAEKNAVKADDLGKILTAHAERQAKLITDPAKVELKTELKQKDGTPIEINRDSPLMKAALTMAKDRGWTSDDLTAMTDLVIAGQLAAQEADEKEYLTIGNGDRAKADQRLSAAITKGAAMLAADEKGNATPEAKAALERLFTNVHTRADFETLEKIINGQAGPGAAAAGGGGGKIVDMASAWYPNEAKKAS